MPVKAQKPCLTCGSSGVMVLPFATFATCMACKGKGYHECFVPAQFSPILSAEEKAEKQGLETAIAMKVARFHAKAADHKPGCELFSHFMQHIDQKTGEIYDCLHDWPCGCGVEWGE